MSGVIDRELFAHLIIIGAVCFGGWMLAIEPRAKELSELEELVGTDDGGSVTYNVATAQAIAHRLQDVNARVSEVRSFNDVAADSSVLYDTFMGLATSHAVSLKRFQPGELLTPVGPSAGALILSMQIEGPYENVASYLNEVDELNGFFRPVSLTMSPGAGTGEDADVIVRFQCEALAFDVPEELESLDSSWKSVESASEAGNDE